MSLAQALWARFASWLVSDPDRVEYLIDRAKRTPYYNLDGYMNRWWLVKPSRFLPFAVRIHRILRADVDRNPHNHPWNYRSIVLRGSYREHLMAPDGCGCISQVVDVGMTYSRHSGQYHRIAEVSKGGAWTLFIIGRKHTEWGFMVNGRHVYWREYLGVWEGV